VTTYRKQASNRSKRRPDGDLSWARVEIAGGPVGISGGATLESCIALLCAEDGVWPVGLNG
jgi:hypothetical protein